MRFYKTLVNIADIAFKSTLKAINNGVLFTEYDFNAKFIKVRCLGSFCKKADLQKFIKTKIEDSYLYDLYFFRDLNELNDFKTNAPTKATIILNKYVKRPREPYVINVKRPADMYVLAPHELNTSYSGYFCRIDLHSAEPYFLMQELPELEHKILELYMKRREFAEVKKTLVCLNGICRNFYISIYNNVCNKLFAKMEQTVDLLTSKGLYPFYLARDGILVRADKKEDLEAMQDYLDIGEEIGQWDTSPIEYGTCTTGNTAMNYTTTLESQRNVQVGSIKDTEIMHIQPIFDKITNTRYIIHDSLEWRKSIDLTRTEVNFWE